LRSSPHYPVEQPEAPIVPPQLQGVQRPS
jgi:hypothetical protein